MKLYYILFTILFTACNISKPTKNEATTDAANETIEVTNKDKSLRLHDIWALVSIGGEKINLQDFQKHPVLEINLTENRIMGNDGCNNIFGSIKTVNDNQLEFSQMGGTKMACPNMDLSGNINSGLSKTHTYKLQKLELSLMDSVGIELLKYKKVD
jgi:heat shock protein HslJ